MSHTREVPLAQNQFIVGDSNGVGTNKTATETTALLDLATSSLKGLMSASHYQKVYAADTPNFVTNGTFENNSTTGVDYFGTGSPSYTVAITSTAGEVLNGSYSLKIKTGEGVNKGPMITLGTIDPFYIGKPLYFKVNTRALTDYAANDFYACVIDDTTDAVVANTSINIPAGDYEAKGFFIVEAASPNVAKSYAIGFLGGVATANHYLSIDDIVVSPQQNIYANAVTDWTNISTITTSLTFVTKSAKYRRVGDSIQVSIHGTNVTGGSGTSTIDVLTGLGLTMDTSKFNRSAYNHLGEGYALDGTNSDAYNVAVLQNNTSTTSVVLLTTPTSTTNYAFIASAAPFTADSATEMNFIFTVPIVGWSSNIQVADRALEEFVSHDGSNIVYGIFGAATPTATPASVIERLAITTGFNNIQATDNFILEFNIANTSRWINFNGNTYVDSLRYDGTNFIGATVEALADGSINLVRGKYCRAATDTWAATLPANTRWRVRKTSGGVQVGSTAISARNIIGDTTGTAVPSGYLGQVLTGYIDNGSAGAASGTTNLITIPDVTAGTWSVDLYASGDLGGASVISYVLSSTSGTSNTIASAVINTGASGANWNSSPKNATANSFVTSKSIKIKTSSTITLYLNINRASSVAMSSIYCDMTVTRIA